MSFFREGLHEHRGMDDDGEEMEIVVSRWARAVSGLAWVYVCLVVCLWTESSYQALWWAFGSFVRARFSASGFDVWPADHGEYVIV